MLRVQILAVAVIMDWFLGDPYWLPHPIRAIGWLIQRTESLVTGWGRSRRWQGVLLWLVVVLTVLGVSWLGVEFFRWMHPLAGLVVETLLLYTCLAARCLDQEGQKVEKELQAGDLSQARLLLSYLVGRETEQLSAQEVVRGTVETVAENIVDGVVSPLFYAFLGGAPLALAYKAVNTLDSMVGYKNERYLKLGWASARFDDLANLIPARLTGILIPLAAIFTGANPQASWQIMWRDRKNHTSPNAGHPEAAVAGALQVQLGGANYYFGQLVEKPTLGDPVQSLIPEMIGHTARIMYWTEVWTFGLLAGVTLLVS